MLQLTGVSMLGVGAVAAASGCSSDNSATDDSQTQPEATTVRVYDPTGGIEITQSFADRLDTLEGKTIAFISNDGWEAERTFAYLNDLILAEYPSVTIINWDQFIHGTDNITKEKNGIADKLQEMGVDAAIVGNAG